MLVSSSVVLSLRGDASIVSSAAESVRRRLVNRAWCCVGLDGKAACGPDCCHGRSSTWRHGSSSQAGGSKCSSVASALETEHAHHDNAEGLGPVLGVFACIRHHKHAAARGTRNMSTICQACMLAEILGGLYGRRVVRLPWRMPFWRHIGQVLQELLIVCSRVLSFAPRQHVEELRGRERRRSRRLVLALSSGLCSSCRGSALGGRETKTHRVAPSPDLVVRCSVGCAGWLRGHGKERLTHGPWAEDDGATWPRSPRSMLEESERLTGSNACIHFKLC